MIRPEIIERLKVLGEKISAPELVSQKKYIFSNFLNFSHEEKDYIKNVDSLLYKQLMSSIKKDLPNCIAKGEIVYPFPNFANKDTDLFQDYFNLLIKKENIEQIEHYVQLSNSNPTLNKALIKCLRKNNNITQKVALAILSKEDNSPDNSLALQMSWPEQKEYFELHKNKFSDIIDYNEQNIEKYNKNAIKNVLEVVIDIQWYKGLAENENYTFNKILRESPLLLHFILEEKLEEFREVFAIEVNFGAGRAPIATSLLFSLGYGHVNNKDSIAKTLSLLPQFFSESFITYQKYYVSTKTAFVDYIFTNSEELILPHAMTLLDYVNEEQKKKICGYQFHLFTQNLDTKHLENIPQEILLELASNFEKSFSKTEHKCSVILDKYLLNAQIKKENTNKRTHKI